MAPILIIGGTGTVGQHVVRGLRSRSLPVRVTSRDRAKVVELFGNDDGVEVVVGDYTNPDSFEADPFVGVERALLLSSSVCLDQTQVEIRLIKMACAANVQQIVRLSALGASTSEPSNSLFCWHGDIDLFLRHAGIPFTLLQPTLFFQNHLRDDVASIRDHGILTRPADDCRVSLVDARDVAYAAEEVLADPIDEHAGSTYLLTGPQALTFTELCSIISRVLNKQVTYQSTDDITWFNGFQAQGWPKRLAHLMTKLFQFYRQGGNDIVAGDYEILTGRKPRSAEQFFTDFAHLFKL